MFLSGVTLASTAFNHISTHEGPVGLTHRDVIIYSSELKIANFAKVKDGRFASDPAPGTIEKLGPGRVGCEDAFLAKAKVQISIPMSICTYEKICVLRSRAYSGILDKLSEAFKGEGLAIDGCRDKDKDMRLVGLLPRPNRAGAV